MLTAQPLSTQRFPRSSNVMQVGYAESLELLPDAPATKRLSHALGSIERSSDETDSTMVFTLHGSTDDGSIEAELAEGTLSLRKLWTSGEDVRRSPLQLMSPQGTLVGEATVTLHALHAIRAVTAPPPAAAPAAKDAAKDAAAPAAKAAAPSTAMVASAEQAMAELSAPPEPKPLTRAEEEEVAERVDRAMLWKASQWLEKELDEKGKAAGAAPPPVDEEDFSPNMAHNLLMQFVSFAPDASAPAPDSIYLTFQLYHFAPRTTPRALLQSPADAAAAAARSASAADGGAASRPDAIRVEIGELALGPAARDAPWGHVTVEVRMAGASGTVASGVLRTSSVPKRGRRIDFGFAQLVAVPVGSAAAEEVARALAATDESEAAVTFSLMAPAGRGGGVVEVGSGSVSLHTILRDNADLAPASLPINSRTGFVGSLSVTVLALEALRQIAAADRAATAAAAEAAMGGGSTANARPSRGDDLMLVAADSALAREGPGLVERFLVQPPPPEGEGGGVSVATHADTLAHAEEQSRRFTSYLRGKCVYVDVWDGTSLLQIGTARVPLAALLRRGQERVGAASVVKEYLSVEVIDTALNSIEAAPSADAPAVVEPMLRGKLKLVLARLTVGQPTPKLTSSIDKGLRASGSPEGARQKVRLRALSTSGSNALTAREPTAADEAALYRRQLRRQKQREWLRMSGGGNPSLSASTGALVPAGGVGTVARSLEMGASEEHSLSRARLQLQQRQLRAAEAYRLSHKEERLRALLAESSSLSRYVYPSYGSAELVELPFRNPYSTEHCFTLEWEDELGHLSIVSSLDEWRSLKQRANLATPAEENLVIQGRQLWLMPNEMVYVPFKYQGFQHGQVALHEPSPPPLPPSASRSASALAAMPLAKRTISVRVLNVKTEAVASLDIRVRPQPYVVDQTFRFHQSEHEFLKTTIRLQNVRWHSSGPLPQPVPRATGGTAAVPAPLPFGGAVVAAGSTPQQVFVRSSDPDVVCGVHEQRSPTSPLEVSIKYRCGASPTVTRFLVLIYSDVWMHSLLEVWDVVVHALQRVDVHSLVGQTSLAKALLKGETHTSHGLVQCFSSTPTELALSPSAPFALSNSLTEVKLALRPFHPGRRQYVVHAVDLSRRALLSSWLVCAVNRLPAITKQFTLQVPEALGARKKVALANPYTYDTTFSFYTDAPHLLSFKSPSQLIPAGESRYVGLHFASLPKGSSARSGETKVLVFVNNEEDKNEECMEITVLYTGAA